MEREMLSKTHIMFIPFPAQGHMSPMMQFAKRLAWKGLRITIVLPAQIRDSMQITNPLINTECISFDFDKDDGMPYSMQAYMGVVKLKVTNKLSDLLEKQRTNGYPVNLLVVDSLYPSRVEMCHQLGVKGAPFFTHSCAVGAIYYNARLGKLKIPPEEGLTSVSLPSIPLLGRDDLPIIRTGTFPDLFEHLGNQFSDLDKADWIFFNTFDKLENEEAKWLSSQWPITSIGPLIPSMYLDKQLPNDKDNGIDFYKADVGSCIKWLDAKDPGSVVYASFGSVKHNLGDDYMDEVAWGLLHSKYHFIWVVIESERTKLSSDFLAEAEAEEKGLIVSWCPQLQVLSHKSIGSFMTHCGWNSTVEALSLGVPMVAVPQQFDQPVNAKYIVDVWQIGVRVPIGEEGVVLRGEVANCIKDIMEGEIGDELRGNALKWKGLAVEAMEKGGSSDKNIDEFISKLVSS
uniref:UDP-glycosyltransferase 3GT1 n=1 Tax=Panax quinquefolius TaxID=44588 RepID=A0A0M4LS39_PANQU|nr:UDP-glycosyltransferase 3GT1 [Panax quinquefolius]